LQPTKILLGAALAIAVGTATLVAAQAPAPAPAAPQTQSPAPAAGRGGRGAAPAGGGGFANAYPQHAQADAAAVARGKQLFGVNCSFCHGSDARGGEGGPNLLRSHLVMDDQAGEAIAVVVQNGRPDRGMPKFDLTNENVSDIAAFIHSFRVAGYDASRDIPPNIVVGDPKAGEAYFNGAGKCNTCHSATGDLAGIGAKLEPKALQNAFVSGGGGGRGAAPPIPVPPTMVKVTLPSGEVVEGKLDRVDDFEVSLVETNGTHRMFGRNGSVPKVEVIDPLQGHLNLLSKYTDNDIHNVTAYLVTLK
jgi:cytochrome c oxidase cbb3-type subunit 3